MTKQRLTSILVTLALLICAFPLEAFTSVQQTNEVFNSQVYVRKDSAWVPVNRSIALDSAEALSLRQRFDRYYSNKKVGILLTGATTLLALKPLQGIQVAVFSYNADANTFKKLEFAGTDANGFWRFNVPAGTALPLRLIAASVTENHGLLRNIRDMATPLAGTPVVPASSGGGSSSGSRKPSPPPVVPPVLCDYCGENPCVCIIADPDGSLKTIIEAALPGEIVQVRGEHTVDEIINVPEGVTIKGTPESKITMGDAIVCQPGVDQWTPIALFEIKGNDVTLDNLTIDCNNNGSNIINAKGSYEGITVSNNTFINCETERYQNSAVVFLDGVASPCVEGNTFEYGGLVNRAIQIAFQRSTEDDPTIISDNTINGNENATANGVIEIMQSNGGKIIINGNKIFDVKAVTSVGSSDFKSAAIHLYEIRTDTIILIDDNEIGNCDYGITVYKADAQITISENSITNTGPLGYGILLDTLGRRGKPPYSVTVTITSSGNVASTTFWGEQHSDLATVTVDGDPFDLTNYVALS